MEKKKLTIATVVMIVIVVALVVTIAMLAPKTWSDYQTLERERAATPTPTAIVSSMLQVTVDPNNTPAPTTQIVRVGSAGDEVKRIQQRLLDLGYYADQVDGQFGQGTAEAVKRFQIQHNLLADGIAGDNTRSILYGDKADPYIPTPEPSATPSMLSKGDANDSVRALQDRLKTLGYYSGTVDGDFGGGTQEAVRLFQDQNQLDVDGIAAEKTTALIFSEQANPVTATPTPDPASRPILVNKKYPMDKNDKPSDLVKLKNVLPSSLVLIKGNDIEGNRTAVAAMQTMFEAAKNDNVTEFQVSAGYRSHKYQQSLFDKQVKKYQDEGKSKESAISSTKLTVADPGASEHHTGLAFDITTPGTTFKGTTQQKWLQKHCWDYGFVIRYQEDKEKITGFLAECWHIRYVGIQHSTVMRDKNQCLEEYLGEI